MKLLLILLIFPGLAFAESAQYLFQDQGQSRSLMKTAHQDSVSFDIQQEKSINAEAVIKNVTLNGKVFAIDLQDEFRSDQRIPFFKVNFKHYKEKEIYALAGTKGTSGSQLHYFIRRKSGEFVYSGLLPEVYFDEDEKKFLSLEKDGPRLFISQWKIENEKFILVKSWEEK